jgi:hypothetical protein
MRFHEDMSVIQMEPRKSSQQLTPWMGFHVSDSNGAQEVYNNLRPGWDFMKACQ